MGNLVTASAEIAVRIRHLDAPADGARRITPLLRLATERDAADLAPELADDSDPEAAHAAHRRQALPHWEGH